MSEIANLNKIADLEGRVIMLRGLLMQVEKKMVFCLLCDGRLDNFGERDTLKALGYIVGHADDCELAEEFGDD